MKVPGSQLEFLVDRQLEKVQKVGAQSLTTSETSEIPTNGMGLSKVTFLYKDIFPYTCSQFLQLEKTHSRTLAKSYKNQGEEIFNNK